MYILQNIMIIKSPYLNRDQWKPWLLEHFFFNFLKHVINLIGWPGSLKTFLSLADALGFRGPFETMRQLQCSVIYEDKAVSSARFHGIKGLGSELTRRSEELARERGCTHTYAMVTGQSSNLGIFAATFPFRQIFGSDL